MVSEASETQYWLEVIKETTWLPWEVLKIEIRNVANCWLFSLQLEETDKEKRDMSE